MMKENLIKLSNILIFICCLQACTSIENQYTNNKYFQYYISTIRIQNPRVVLFYEQGSSYSVYDPPMNGFVCPDSAVKYCTDRDWRERNDVFLLNACEFHDENSLFHAHGKRKYKLKPWDNGQPWQDPEPFNDTIHIGRFYFDEDLTFILSMHSTNYMTWDSRDPEEGDLPDTAEYANTYRLAVRPKYSIWQTYKISKLIRESPCYELIEFPDTTLLIPVECNKD